MLPCRKMAQRDTTTEEQSTDRCYHGEHGTDWCYHGGTWCRQVLPWRDMMQTGVTMEKHDADRCYHGGTWCR